MNEQKWWAGSLAAVTVLAALLRFAALGEKTLWVDEAFSLWMARHPLPDLFTWLVKIDHHPPLYYLLLHTWINLFGDTAAALRGLSALAGMLAIPIYALAARKLCGTQVAMVATLLLAISPFQLRYAQETRMYSLLLLAVAFVLLALAHLLTVREGAVRLRWWLLLCTAEAAAMLTHNTATVLIPLALNVAVGGLWLAQRWGWRTGEVVGLAQPRFYAKWLLSQIVALLLWSPWAWAFVQQARDVDSGFWIAPPDLWTVWLALGSLSFAHLPVWLPQRDYLAWLALALVAWGVWQWRRSAGVTWLLAVLWLLPPLVELVVSLRRPVFYDRTLIWTAMPYTLLVARGMVLPKRVIAKFRGGWLFVTLTLFGGLCALGLWGYFTDFEKERWDEAARYVAAAARPQELILFHASWAELPFAYYYAGDMDTGAAPPLVHHGVPVDLFDAGEVEPPMSAAALPRLFELTEGQQRVWLIYSHWWYTDPEALLPRALAEEFEIVETREWPGIRVMLYQRQ